MFKRHKEIEIKIERKTIFNISSDEAKEYLASIIKDVNTIVSNDKFMEATKKVKLPENATIQDYANLVKKTVPTKIYNFLMLFIDDCYDEVRRILSAIFVTDFEDYRKKSIMDMVQDISSLGTGEIAEILGFFIRSNK